MNAAALLDAPAAPPVGAAGRYRGPLFGSALLAYLAGTVVLAHSSSYQQGLLLVAAVYSILALSLDLVAGATGLYSLGHAGLFAIGAYGTTILANTYHWNVFLALPLAVVAVGLVGVVIGALSLRVSGLYFAITTLIFTIIVNVLLSNLGITGGYQGLASPSFPSFPHGWSLLGTALVWAVSGAVLLAVTVIWSMRASAMYPVLLAIRDSEPFAAAAGVRTKLTRVAVFGLSAALAGLAGWTFSYLGFITPGQFDATAAVNILVMVILGGMNTRLGPICGAVFVSLFPVVINMNPLWQEILFGCVFIFVIVFFPEGFVGLVARGGRRLGAMLRRHEAPLAAAVLEPASLNGARRSNGGYVPLEEPVAGNGAGGRPVPSRTPAGPAVAAAAVAGAAGASGTVAPTWGAAARGSAPALEAKGISFSYVKGVTALDSVDIVVAPGTIHGLIGPNGSGKSTLVNLLSGVSASQRGTITVHGTRAENLRAWERAGLGLMRTFQTAGMVRELTTRDNVTIGLFSRFDHIGARSLAWPFIPSARRDSRTMAAVATRALGEVGLGEQWVRSRVADVPHGVEQLTELAAACVGKPSILILDEPLAGLSSSEVDDVAAILRELKSRGVTIIVVEHQTRFIFEVCDEVTVLAAGELVTSGSAAEVRTDARVREVYLGQ